MLIIGRFNFLIADKKDPSLKLALGDYWRMNTKAQKGVHQQYGQDFATNFTVEFGLCSKDVS